MNYGQGGGGGQYPPGYTQPGYPAQNPYGQPPNPYGQPANAYQPVPGMPMGQPPPKSNVGLIIGIVAGVLGLVLVVFLVFVFAIFRAASSSTASNGPTGVNQPSDNTSSNNGNGSNGNSNNSNSNNSNSNSNNNELSLSFLQNVARDASVGLPRMLDADTQEVSVTAEPGTLVYHNRLTTKSVNQLSVPVFTQILKPSIVSNDCSSKAVRNSLLLKGVTLRYSYVDRFGSFIAAIDITKHDCGI